MGDYVHPYVYICCCSHQLLLQPSGGLCPPICLHLLLFPPAIASTQWGIMSTHMFTSAAVPTSYCFNPVGDYVHPYVYICCCSHQLLLQPSGGLCAPICLHLLLFPPAIASTQWGIMCTHMFTSAAVPTSYCFNPVGDYVHPYVYICCCSHQLLLQPSGGLCAPICLHLLLFPPAIASTQWGIMCTHMFTSAAVPTSYCFNPVGDYVHPYVQNITICNLSACLRVPDPKLHPHGWTNQAGTLCGLQSFLGWKCLQAQMHIHDFNTHYKVDHRSPSTRFCAHTKIQSPPSEVKLE